MKKFRYSWSSHILNRLDPILICLLIIASTISLLCLYSAAHGEFFFVKRQGIRLLIATLFMLAITAVPFEKIKSNTLLINFICLSLLLWVMTSGHIGKGAQRWIDLGVARFEPSELFKIAIPLLAAKYISSVPSPIRLSNSIGLFLLLCIPISLVLLQPDLGTAIILLSVGLSSIFIAGLNYRIIVTAAAACIALLPISWNFLHDYQKNRVINFFNPDNDPLGTGYHILQSKIAVGSGGLFGHGFLAGPQVHLKFVPEHYTDFVFSLIGEEFGFIGTSTILLLFLVLAIRGFYLAIITDDLFTKITIASLTFAITLSSIINIAMTVGLLPVVGVPLPLISYGGSNLLTTFMTVGIIQSARYADAR